MKTLKEKYGTTGLITGASSGIGRSFAQRLAAEGFDVVLVARRRSLLEQIRDELSRCYNVQVTVIVQDLASADGALRICHHLADLGTEIDVLVNNAGFGAYGEFERLDLERQLDMVDVNCRAVVDLAHRLIAPMKARRRGAVITVSSALAYFPSCHFAVYSATKAFDLLFGEALYGELKPYGVDAIAIAPTLTATNFQSESRMRPMPIAMRRPEQVVATTLKFLGRRASVVDGFSTRMALLLIRCLPRTWVLRLSRWFMSARSS